MLTPAELVWLLAAVAKGDQAAFERLYGATRAKLFGVALRILRRQDLAEAEATCAVMARVWPALGYELVWLPKAPVAERVAFIMARLDPAR